MKIVTITGHTCSGKSTLEKVLKCSGKFSPVISTTTRPQRFGEADWVSYHFVQLRDFNEMFHADEFVEAIRFNKDWYGISEKALLEATKGGNAAVVVCEPSGARQVRRYCQLNGHGLVQVFIDTPEAECAERFLLRALSGNIELEKARRQFAGRMAEMMTTERGWVNDARSGAQEYDIIFNCLDLDFMVDEVTAAIARL